jgi:hypothetical protein
VLWTLSGTSYDTGWHTLVKADVGLSNVDNTADSSKPVSTAQAAADTAVQAFAIQRANHTGTQSADTLTDGTTNKAFLATERTKLSGVATGATANTGTVTTVSVVTANGVSGSVANATTTPAITLTLGALTPTSVAASGTVTGSNLSGTNTGDQTLAGLGGQPASANLTAWSGLATSAKENAITATTSADYYRGDKTMQPLNKAAVGLSNVDNTSDANKPVSTAQAAADAAVQAFAIQRANHTGTQLKATISDLPTLVSGTYTPVITNATNVAASTAYVCQYLRVGNVVTVSGKVDIDPTAASVSTVITLSLPIASVLASSNQVGGTAVCPSIAGLAGGISGAVASGTAALAYIGNADVASRSWYFTFTYLVL